MLGFVYDINSAYLENRAAARNLSILDGNLD